ncbi:glycosyltransferase [Janibacter sp. YIM B02568]|uniref:glycosyltransferase n=1 Tax=Janibacter endophyticus TaxID=2806261 RepID=UPI00194F29E7|nr:glycosyltransferase [Janibacter endophyticus]MBM6545752.1 glycosyltransferase [Janibacter endophyticus]
MSSRPSQIVYLGPFRLPDLNAAAQRVLANAKGLRQLGHDVVLAETGTVDGRGGPIERLPAVEGFTCYRLPMNQRPVLDSPQLSIRQIADLCDALDSPRAVIAYNYPAVALTRLSAYCRRRGIACGADVTEWYGTSHLASRAAQAMKWTDTTLRMKVVHRRLDALVVISRFLENTYHGRKVPCVVRIPPLVDADTPKWHRSPEEPLTSELRLVYAGSPSAEKERLDATVAAVVTASQSVPIHLDVVGVTSGQFQQIYPSVPLPSRELVTFHGRVSHEEALGWVAQADFSVIARDRSRVTDAGFPTKFVESITLGTPAVVTPHPDLTEILADGQMGTVVPLDGLDRTLVDLHTDRWREVDRKFFDHRRYQAEFSALSAGLGLPV